VLLKKMHSIQAEDAEVGVLYERGHKPDSDKIEEQGRPDHWPDSGNGVYWVGWPTSGKCRARRPQTAGRGL